MFVYVSSTSSTTKIVHFCYCQFFAKKKLFIVTALKTGTLIEMLNVPNAKKNRKREVWIIWKSHKLLAERQTFSKAQLSQWIIILPMSE